MKVALTGATGFIGSHALTELHKHGHEVTALVRDDAHPVTPDGRGVPSGFPLDPLWRNQPRRPVGC